MSRLAKVYRVKLAKTLALTVSDQPGEVLAAAAAANRLVSNSGLTWRQVLEPAPVEKKLPELGTWRGTVARLLERPGSLRPWERSFLQDLPGFRRITVKQRYVLKEIADRVLGEGVR